MTDAERTQLHADLARLLAPSVGPLLRQVCGQRGWWQELYTSPDAWALALRVALAGEA